MELARSIFARSKQRVQAKLGRCWFCIRTSGIGTLASWGAVAATALLWPNRFLLPAVLFVAAAFTLLLVAHIAAFGARIAIAAATHEAHRQPPASDGTQDEPVTVAMGRRRFFRVAALGSLAGLSLALLGRLPFAMAQTCADASHSYPSNAFGDTSGSCRKALKANAQSPCAATCGASSSACASDQTCAGRVSLSNFSHSGTACFATVTCKCACRKVH